MTSTPDPPSTEQARYEPRSVEPDRSGQVALFPPGLQRRFGNAAVSTMLQGAGGAAGGVVPGPDLVATLRTLKARDGALSEAMPAVRRAPDSERRAVYADDRLRDWFVDLCDDIEMLYLVQALGGRLIHQLRWMASENSDWYPVYVLLYGGGSGPEERREVLESAELRQFFQRAYGDARVFQAVELLAGAGDLSLQMEWLHAEGADRTPGLARERPEIASRDERLMEALDRASPLFRLFEAEENARAAVRSHRLAKAMAPGGVVLMFWSDPIAERLAAEQAAAEAALDAELRTMGYADRAAFTDEFRRFAAFFHGFALQTAFQMLSENRAVAERERERMRDQGTDDLFAELAPVRALHVARREHDLASMDVPDAGVGPATDRAATARERKEQLESQVADLMPRLAERYPIIARDDQQGWVVEHADDRDAMRRHFREFSTSTIEDIDKVRKGLAADSSKLWKMPPVIARAKATLRVAEGTAMDGIVKRKIAEVESDETWRNLVIGAFAIGLGLLTMGTGTVAVLAAVGAAGLSGYQVAQSWDEYSFASAAHGSALDLAAALAAEKPSVVWLLIDIAGALLDLKGVTTAGRAAAPLTKESVQAAVGKASAELGEAAAKLRYAPDARAAAEAALELEARAAGFSPEVRALVHEAAQREVARTAILTEAPDLVRSIEQIVPPLAEDRAALAGLVRMGEAAALPLTRALAKEKDLLVRLGRLCAQDPALARGAARLRDVAGDAATVSVLRDALMRRDTAYARRLLGAAGDGHLSDDALSIAARGGPAAAERELAAATGLPTPGTPEARAALDATADVQGAPANILDLRNEWEAVLTNPGVRIQEGDYVVEVTLPNRHKWKQHKGGGWCRYSIHHCLTGGQLATLQEASLDPLARAVRTAEDKAAAAERLLSDPSALGKRFDRVRRSGIDPDAEFSDLEQEVLHEVLVRENQKRARARLTGAKGVEPVPLDLDELTPAQVRSTFSPPDKLGRMESPAQQVVREADESALRALRELAESSRPLLDKLHAALRQRTKDWILKRARKSGVAFDEFLQAPPPNGALDIDHVFPLEEIVDLPGFKTRLKWIDQVVIANAIGNLKAVDFVVNRSRQAASYASNFAGRSHYTAEALGAAQKFEPEAKRVIMELYERAMKKPGSLTMEDIWPK